MCIFVQELKLTEQSRVSLLQRSHHFSATLPVPRATKIDVIFKHTSSMKIFSFFLCYSHQMWHWFEKTRVLFSPGVTAAHIEMYDFRWHLVTFNIWDWCALKSFFPIKVIDSCIYILLNINKSNACWSWPYKVNFLVTFSKITWRNNSVFVYILTPQLVRCQMPTKCTAAKFFVSDVG